MLIRSPVIETVGRSRTAWKVWLILARRTDVDLINPPPSQPCAPIDVIELSILWTNSAASSGSSEGAGCAMSGVDTTTKIGCSPPVEAVVRGDKWSVWSRQG